MNKHLLIVAGGSGLRMNADIPKQFLLLQNRPIILRTIDCFLKWDSKLHLVVILPESQFLYWRELCLEHNFTVPHLLVAGGENRFDSVKNGLSHLDNSDVVLIHDGVRPFVSVQTIQNCFDAAVAFGAAIPVMDSVESLRFSDNEKNFAVDRNLYKTVQTPQVFRSEIIKSAYNQECSPQFTDDASVVEKNGISVKLVPGNRENIKITTPLDLIFGAAILSTLDK